MAQAGRHRSNLRPPRLSTRRLICGRPVIALANYHGVDSSKAVFSFRSMAVETLGEAWRLGWKLTARCAFGNRDGMKSIRPCIYRAPLDMQTLVWTRGPNFPLSRLESRLMCPECGSRRVSVLFDVPKVPVAATHFASRSDTGPGHGPGCFVYGLLTIFDARLMRQPEGH